MRHVEAEAGRILPLERGVGGHKGLCKARDGRKEKNALKGYTPVFQSPGQVFKVPPDSAFSRRSTKPEQMEACTDVAGHHLFKVGFRWVLPDKGAIGTRLISENNDKARRFRSSRSGSGIWAT